MRCLNGVAVLIMAAAMSVYAPPAEATGAGCSGKYRLMADTMVYDWYEPRALNRLPIDPYHERFTATVAYYHCPNGRRPAKVKPDFISWCYSHLSGDWPFWFDGFKGNAFFADTGNLTNPKTVKVSDNKYVQNCRTQPLDDIPWLRLDHHAGWKATGWYVRDGLPNEELMFKDANGWEFHLFLPENDVALGDWQ